MIWWEKLTDDTVVFTPARRCSKNRGVTNNNGTKQPSQHNIYVDENLMANIAHRLRHTFASAIEAIFVIMGAPNLMLRPCVVALDKWVKLHVCVVQVLRTPLEYTRNAGRRLTWLLSGEC